MAAAATQAVLDMPAAEFRLPATDGKTYALDDVAGEKARSSRHSGNSVACPRSIPSTKRLIRSLRSRIALRE
jgi:hypothetical protein